MEGGSLVWRARPSSLLAHAKEEGSSKGHSLKCNCNGNLKCVMLTLHTSSG